MFNMAGRRTRFVGFWMPEGDVEVVRGWADRRGVTMSEAWRRLITEGMGALLMTVPEPSAIIRPLHPEPLISGVSGFDPDEDGIA